MSQRDPLSEFRRFNIVGGILHHGQETAFHEPCHSTQREISAPVLQLKILIISSLPHSDIMASDLRPVSNRRGRDAGAVASFLAQATNILCFSCIRNSCHQKNHVRRVQCRRHAPRHSRRICDSQNSARRHDRSQCTFDARLSHRGIGRNN